MRSDPLEQLDRSHRRHDQEMYALVEAAERGDLDAAADGIAYLERATPRHFADEEASVFPRAIARDPALQDTLRRIGDEHRVHERHHARLRELLDAGDVAGLIAEARALDAAYAVHVRAEDDLMPRLREVLTPQDLEEISAEMQARRGRPRV